MAEDKVEELSRLDGEVAGHQPGTGGGEEQFVGDEGDKRLLEGVARAAIKYISREYNVPEEVVEEVVKDVLREPDVVEELMGTVRKVKGIVDMLRAGKISSQVADAEMAKIIKAVGDKIVERIRGDVFRPPMHPAYRPPYQPFYPYPYPYPPQPCYWQPYPQEDAEFKSMMRTAFKYAVMLKMLDSVGGRRDDHGWVSAIISAMSDTTSSIVSALAGKVREPEKDEKYEELRKELEDLKQMLEKREREKEIDALRKDLIQYLDKMKQELERKLDEKVGVVRERVDALEKSYDEIVKRMKEALDGLKKAIEEGNINKAREEVKKAEDMFGELRQMSKTIEELKSILESLGYKVVHPGSTELEKEKVSRMYDIFDKYIGPALKELLTDPAKLVKAVKELRGLAEESAGGGVSVSVGEEMPRIE